MTKILKIINYFRIWNSEFLEPIRWVIEYQVVHCYTEKTSLENTGTFITNPICSKSL